MSSGQSLSLTSRQAAVTYQLLGLRETCMSFIEEHPAVFKSNNFVYISEDTLTFILESDKLQVDEKDIVAIVKQWGDVNAVSTRGPLCTKIAIFLLRHLWQVATGKPVSQVVAKVIEKVRFPLIPADILSKLEKDNEKSGIIPVQIALGPGRP